MTHKISLLFSIVLLSSFAFSQHVFKLYVKDGVYTVSEYVKNTHRTGTIPGNELKLKGQVTFKKEQVGKLIEALKSVHDTAEKTKKNSSVVIKYTPGVKSYESCGYQDLYKEGEREAKIVGKKWGSPFGGPSGFTYKMQDSRCMSDLWDLSWEKVEKLIKLLEGGASGEVKMS